MKTACFIPFKKRSTRVPGKNFRELGGKPLWRWAVDAALEAKCFESIYVDTDCEETLGNLPDGVSAWNRDPELVKDTKNGNDLICHWADNTSYDLYVQLFVTSPFTKPETLCECVDSVALSCQHDSSFTAQKMSGWFWFEGQPVNYRPSILPRSQDAQGVIQETTAVYAVTREAIMQYRCRVGARPKAIMVDSVEAIDIDYEFDFEFAQYIVGKELF